MSRLSRAENANRVPHPRANLAFTLFTLGAVLNNAAIEGFSSSMESVRNVSTIALIGFAAISFLKGVRRNLDPVAPRYAHESVQQPVHGFPSLAEQAGRLSPPIIEGAAAMPLEDALWLAQTGQRPVPVEADEAAAIRAHSAAVLREGLA